MNLRQAHSNYQADPTNFTLLLILAKELATKTDEDQALRAEAAQLIRDNYDHYLNQYGELERTVASEHADTDLPLPLRGLNTQTKKAILDIIEAEVNIRFSMKLYINDNTSSLADLESTYQKLSQDKKNYDENPSAFFSLQSEPERKLEYKTTFKASLKKAILDAKKALNIINGIIKKLDLAKSSPLQNEEQQEATLYANTELNKFLLHYLTLLNFIAAECYTEDQKKVEDLISSSLASIANSKTGIVALFVFQQHNKKLFIKKNISLAILSSPNLLALKFALREEGSLNPFYDDINNIFKEAQLTAEEKSHYLKKIIDQDPTCQVLLEENNSLLNQLTLAIRYRKKIENNVDADENIAEETVNALDHHLKMLDEIKQESKSEPFKIEVTNEAIRIKQLRLQVTTVKKINNELKNFEPYLNTSEEDIRQSLDKLKTLFAEANRISNHPNTSQKEKEILSKALLNAKEKIIGLFVKKGSCYSLTEMQGLSDDEYRKSLLLGLIDNIFPSVDQIKELEDYKKFPIGFEPTFNDKSKRILNAAIHSLSEAKAHKELHEILHQKDIHSLLSYYHNLNEHDSQYNIKMRTYLIMAIFSHPDILHLEELYKPLFGQLLPLIQWLHAHNPSHVNEALELLKAKERTRLIANILEAALKNTKHEDAVNILHDLLIVEEKFGGRTIDLPEVKALLQKAAILDLNSLDPNFAPFTDYLKARIELLKEIYIEGIKRDIDKNIDALIPTDNYQELTQQAVTILKEANSASKNKGFNFSNDHILKLKKIIKQGKKKIAAKNISLARYLLEEKSHLKKQSEEKLRSLSNPDLTTLTNAQGVITERKGLELQADKKSVDATNNIAASLEMIKDNLKGIMRILKTITPPSAYDSLKRTAASSSSPNIKLGISLHFLTTRDAFDYIVNRYGKTPELLAEIEFHIRILILTGMPPKDICNLVNTNNHSYVAIALLKSPTIIEYLKNNTELHHRIIEITHRPSSFIPFHTAPDLVDAKNNEYHSLQKELKERGSCEEFFQGEVKLSPVSDALQNKTISREASIDTQIRMLDRSNLIETLFKDESKYPSHVIANSFRLWTIEDFDQASNRFTHLNHQKIFISWTPYLKLTQPHIVDTLTSAQIKDELTKFNYKTLTPAQLAQLDKRVRLFLLEQEPWTDAVQWLTREKCLALSGGFTNRDMANASNNTTFIAAFGNTTLDFHDTIALQTKNNPLLARILLHQLDSGMWAKDNNQELHEKITQPIPLLRYSTLHTLSCYGVYHLSNDYNLDIDEQKINGNTLIEDDIVTNWDNIAVYDFISTTRTDDYASSTTKAFEFAYTNSRILNRLSNEQLNKGLRQAATRKLLTPIHLLNIIKKLIAKGDVENATKLLSIQNQFTDSFFKHNTFFDADHILAQHTIIALGRKYAKGIFNDPFQPDTKSTALADQLKLHPIKESDPLLAALYSNPQYIPDACKVYAAYRFESAERTDQFWSRAENYKTPGLLDRYLPPGASMGLKIAALLSTLAGVVGLAKVFSSNKSTTERVLDYVFPASMWTTISTIATTAALVLFGAATFNPLTIAIIAGICLIVVVSVCVATSIGAAKAHQSIRDTALARKAAGPLEGEEESLILEGLKSAPPKQIALTKMNLLKYIFPEDKSAANREKVLKTLERITYSYTGYLGTHPDIAEILETIKAHEESKKGFGGWLLYVIGRPKLSYADKYLALKAEAASLTPDSTAKAFAALDLAEQALEQKAHPIAIPPAGPEPAKEQPIPSMNPFDPNYVAPQPSKSANPFDDKNAPDVEYKTAPKKPGQGNPFND